MSNAVENGVTGKYHFDFYDRVHISASQSVRKNISIGVLSSRKCQFVQDARVCIAIRVWYRDTEYKIFKFSKALDMQPTVSNIFSKIDYYE